MNRRNFFQIAAAAAAITEQIQTPAFADIGGMQKRPPEEVATDEDFWSQVRNEFTTDRTVINFNNGHVSPAPRTVQDAMRRYLDYSNMSPYHTMIQQLEKKMDTVRP